MKPKGMAGKENVAQFKKMCIVGHPNDQSQKSSLREVCIPCKHHTIRPRNTFDRQCIWHFLFPPGKLQCLSVTLSLRTSLLDVLGHPHWTSWDIPM